VEMCGKYSHFRLTLAVEERKIAQPEICEKYFVTKKTSSDRASGNTLKLTRVVWKSTQSSAVVCLNKEFSLRVRVQI